MTLEKLNIDVERTSAPDLNIKFAMDLEPGFPDNLSQFKQIQPMVWQMFEEPRSSSHAKFIASVQILMISLSTVSLWFQSYPMTDYRTIKIENQRLYEEHVSTLNMSNGTFFYENEAMSNQSMAFMESLRVLDNPVSIWLVLLDYLTLSWFLVDFIVRFVFSPDKNMYFLNFNNSIDLIATIWLVIDLISNNFVTSFLLHSCQVIRVIRLFRLLTYHPGLKVIILSVSKCVDILSLLLLVLMIFSTMYGALIFFAEKLTQDDPSENMFISIPDAFWFSLVSLTTIGYGDISPVTLPGRLIGCACVITGVLMIGLPMTIVVEVFSNYYKHLGARSKMPKERRRICPVEAPRARKKAAPKPGA